MRLGSAVRHKTVRKQLGRNSTWATRSRNRFRTYSSKEVHCTLSALARIGAVQYEHCLNLLAGVRMDKDAAVFQPC